MVHLRRENDRWMMCHELPVELYANFPELVLRRQELKVMPI